MMKRALGVTTVALATEYGMALEAPLGLVSSANVWKCMACSAGMDIVDGLVNWKFFEEVAVEISKAVCIMFKLADDPWKICPKIVPQMGY